VPSRRSRTPGEKLSIPLATGRARFVAGVEELFDHFLLTLLDDSEARAADHVHNDQHFQRHHVALRILADPQKGLATLWIILDCECAEVAGDQLAAKFTQGCARGGGMSVAFPGSVKGEDLADLFDQFVDLIPGELGWVLLFEFVEASGKRLDLGVVGRPEPIERDEASSKEVIDVVDRVGEIVGPVHDLGAEALLRQWALPS